MTLFKLLGTAVKGLLRVTTSGPPLTRRGSAAHFYDMGYIMGRDGESYVEPPGEVPELYRKDWWAGYHVGRGRRLR